MMKFRLLLVVALLPLGLSIAHAAGSAQATIRLLTSSGECQLKGKSVFRPPLSLKNQETKVTFTGTLSACPKNAYGITGGTIKTSGSGLATCSSDYSDTQTATGTITWKGAKGTSTYISTSTVIAESNPPATWVAGTMAGGSPLPKGTLSEGETSFKVAKSTKKACKAGTLGEVSVSGTTAPTLAACTLSGTTSFDPPLGLTNQETTVTFDGTISACAKNMDNITGGTVTTTGRGLDSCNPNVTDIVKSSGSIVWDGKVGTNTFNSNTTSLVNSDPIAVLVTGRITGGVPLPIGTPTGGVQPAPTSDKLAKECIEGALHSITINVPTTS